MQFSCEITQLADGRWSAQHSGRDIGTFAVYAPTRDEAAGKLRDEIRYRLEICPCTGELYDTVEIELIEGT